MICISAIVGIEATTALITSVCFTYSWLQLSSTNANTCSITITHNINHFQFSTAVSIVLIIIIVIVVLGGFSTSFAHFFLRSGHGWACFALYFKFSITTAERTIEVPNTDRWIQILVNDCFIQTRPFLIRLLRHINVNTVYMTKK